MRGPSGAGRARGTRTRAPRQRRRRLLRGNARVPMIREHVALVSAESAPPEHLENRSRQRHAVRVLILRDGRGNRPPSARQVYLLPSHPAHLAATLRREQRDDQRIVQRLGEPRQRSAVRILRFSLVQCRPELALGLTRFRGQDSVPALLVGGLSDAQRRVGFDPIAPDREAE